MATPYPTPTATPAATVTPLSLVPPLTEERPASAPTDAAAFIPSHSPATAAVDGETISVGAMHRGRGAGFATPVWTLTFDHGAVVRAAPFGLVGRDPTPDASEYGAQLVAVPDTTRSVSKTHLAFGVDALGLWISDRHSTNGTIVVVGGRGQPASPGDRVRVPYGATVQFGDHSFMAGSQKPA
jgi:hypothetical protein